MLLYELDVGFGLHSWGSPGQRITFDSIFPNIHGKRSLSNNINEGESLRFHPIDNRNPWKMPMGDWAHSLDGVHLE